MAESVEVLVVRAWPDAALERRIHVPAGASVGDVLALAANEEPAFAGFDLSGPVAIFGRRVGLEERVQAGDRVELLRALLNDPKEARRRRVSKSGGS